MSKSRPDIPIDVQRKIYFESGHLCAACGTAFPLERAHIVPWAKSRNHEPENLICLCANCHEKADKDWDEATFRLYKTTPWILRQRVTTKDTQTRSVRVTLDLDPNQFDATHTRLLIFAIAGLLEIPPENVKVGSAWKGSLCVRLLISKGKPDDLVVGFNTDPKRLKKYLSPLTVVSVTSEGDHPKLSKPELQDLLRGFLGVNETTAREIGETIETEATSQELVEGTFRELKSRDFILSEELASSIGAALKGESVMCPRCWGTGYVDLEDISRLGMEGMWAPGWCRYCWCSGRVPAYLPLVRDVHAPPPDIAVTQARIISR